MRPPAKPVTMTGRHFWRSQMRGSGGVSQDSVYFTGPQFVFTGKLEDAWPVCSAASESCRPYTFNPKTGALTIDGAEATLGSTSLTMDGRTYGELGRAVAGTRWDIVLTHANSSGICPLYCSYRTEHLHFMPDGTVVRSSVSSGTGPVDWAVIPDDSKGTYEVTTEGLLRFTFADGSLRVRTLGIYPEDGPDRYPATPAPASCSATTGTSTSGTEHRARAGGDEPDRIAGQLRGTVRVLRPPSREKACPSMPQLVTRSGTMRAHTSSRPAPNFPTPPVACSSTVPITSIPRGVHGSVLGRSSITIATLGLAFMSRYFRDPEKSTPPTSIAASSSETRKPSGTT